MKIAVFGASGQTGREIVTQALERGYEVTAIVREPRAMKLADTRLQTIKGDANNIDSFRDAVRNQDAVVSALGVSGFFHSLRPMTFYRTTARNITDEMKRATVERFLCVTSAGVVKNPGAPLVYNLIVQRLLRHKYEDMRQMEQVVQASGLQWTIVRPFRLTNGKRTGRYRIAANGHLQGGSSISRADIADLLLRELEDGEHLRRALAVSY
jgi:biliverdin reductase / flavin reductase